MERSNRLGQRRPAGRRPAPKPGERPITNRQKALVHVAKAQLGLDEETYREILASFGVQSSKELTERAFQDLMRHLGKLGFQKKGARDQGPRAGAAEGYVDERRRYRDAIERLLMEKNLPWNYARAIGEQMFGVQRLEWLTAEQLHKVMIALIYHKKRG